MSAVYDSQYVILKMFMLAIGYTYLEGCKAATENERIESHLKYCRPNFATYLGKHGIESRGTVTCIKTECQTAAFAAHYLITNIKNHGQRVLSAKP